MSNLLLCNKVGEETKLLVPSAYIGNCSFCKCEIWVSESSKEREVEGYICTDCYPKHIASSQLQFLPPSEAQIKEIADTLKISMDEARRKANAIVHRLNGNTNN
jgi:hypothetical protein